MAVPLELRGLHLAHARHGRLPWQRVVEPAVAIAQAGFPAHPYLVAALSGPNATVRAVAQGAHALCVWLPAGSAIASMVVGLMMLAVLLTRRHRVWPPSAG